MKTNDNPNSEDNVYIHNILRVYYIKILRKQNAQLSVVRRARASIFKQRCMFFSPLHEFF